MSRKNPYAVIHLNDRPVRRNDRFVSNAALLVTGFMVGVAVMSILGVLSAK